MIEREREVDLCQRPPSELDLECRLMSKAPSELDRDG